MAGQLHFDITGDNKNLLRNIEGSKQGIRSLTREAEKESLNLDDIMKRIGKNAAAIGLGFSATQLVRDVARVRGEFQQLEVALNTMLGSEEKANALFQQLVNTAAKTPFDLKGVAGGAKQLLAYGVAAEEVNDTIIRLGDIAAGLSIPLGDLVYLYGTTMTQGRLFTQDLRQFMGRGIPLADELAKQFGVAKDEVGGLVTAGKVGFPEVEKAIRAMTSEGGKFAGLMENQSKTIEGLRSNLDDALDSMRNEIGKSTQDVISGVLTTTIKLVENYEKVGEAIAAIVTMYGTYKAAQAIHIAMMKAENAITAQAILLKSQYAKAGHLITDSMARGAAKSVLFADAQKRIVTAMKAVGKTAGVYGLIALAVTGVVYGIYKLVTAKTAEEKAIERVNKKREEEAKQIQAQKDKINSLLSIIRDETKTRTEQANAYEELKKVAPKLTEEYSLLELQAIDTTEALKKYNEQLDNQRYLATLKSLAKYRAMLKEVEDAQGNWGNVSESTKQALRDMYDIDWKGMGLNQVAANLKADISDMETTVDSFRNGLESKKPLSIRLISAEANVRLLKDDFEKIEKEYLEAKKKFEKGDMSILSFNSIKLKYEMTEKALKEGQNLVAKLKADMPQDKNYGEEYKAAEKAWLKAKKELDDATKNRSKYTTTKYKELVKAEKSAADAFEALGGDPKQRQQKKDEKDAQKKLETQQKLADELVALKEKTNADIAALEKDEHKREMAQIKNNWKERKNELDKLEREWKEKQGGVLTPEQQTALNDARAVNDSKRNKEERQANKQHLEDMLGDIRTYEQKREKVEKDFQEKREKLIDEKGMLREGVDPQNFAILKKQEDDALKAIDEEFASKSETYIAWTESIANMTIKQLNKALTEAQNHLNDAVQDEEASPEDLAIARAQIAQLQKKIKQLQGKGGVEKRSIDEWKDLGDVLSDTAGEFESLGDAIGGTTGEIISSLGSTFTSTVGLMNNIVQFVEICDKGIMNTAGTAVSAVKAVEAASVILAVISAAIQIIQKIADVAKNLHNKQYEKTIEDNQKKIDWLKESYNELEEAASKAYSSDKVSKLRDMNEKLEEQNRLIQEQKTAEESKKGDIDTTQYDDAMEANRKQMAENKKAMEEAIFGEDIQSAIENFADAYAEALEGNMDMNATAKEQAVRMMKNMVMESIKEYVAGSKKMEQIRAKMDALYADGVFSEADQKLIINELEQFNKELDDRFGWAEDLFNEEEASSSSSKRGIATASQESVDENNGRLMSIQLSMGEIKEQMIYTVTYLASMSSGVAAGNNILSDIREQAVRTNGHLEDIVKYTKPLNDKISEVVSAINKINSK